MEFEFERPILELEKRLKDLQSLSEEGQIDLSREIKAIARKIETMKEEIYKGLEPWQATQVARHINRPSTLDYLKLLCGDTFVELHGDRLFADDPAIVTGFALFEGIPIGIIGHQKGHDTEENIFRNFGMPHPEGYRKAMRLMRMAEKFSRPILVLIDTPGAFPGVGAEERGQSEAIARNLMEMSQIRVPIICVIIGEGGSGGALGIGVGNRVLMMQYSIYSVITAEGCAAILWKDAGKSKEAAKALRIRSDDLLRFGLIDGIIPEPLGGAHHDFAVSADNIKKAIRRHLPELMAQTPEQLVNDRYQKFRKMGMINLLTDPEDG